VTGDRVRQLLDQGTHLVFARAQHACVRASAGFAFRPVQACHGNRLRCAIVLFAW
jgi:hypothetical protein